MCCCWVLLLLVVMLVPAAVYVLLLRAGPPQRSRRPPKPLAVEAGEKRVCVIGGGLKGLSACTELQKKGIPFVLFEKESEIGGHWRDLPECYHSVYSRRALEFPDFPFSYHRCGSRHSQFPSSTQIVRYLQDYWTYASICDRTELSTEVTRIEPAREGDEDSEWNVYVKGEPQPRTFVAVIVAGGHKSERQWPEWAPSGVAGERGSSREKRGRGNESGKARMVHVKDIKTFVKKEGERVLVVGGGNTACMVASEEASMAMTPISMTFERPLHILPRTVSGIPITHFAKRWLPPFLQQLLLRFVWWVNFGDYGQYLLEQPTYAVYRRPTAINSELLLFVKMGRVMPRTRVTSLSASGLVRYEGGKEEEVDAILCATGFKNRYALVQAHLDMTGDGSPKGLICGALSVKHKNLFLIGTHRVPGGEGPVWSAVAALISSVILWQRDMKGSSAAVALQRSPLPKLFPRPLPAYDSAVDPHSYFAELRMATWALRAMAATHWTP